MKPKIPLPPILGPNSLAPWFLGLLRGLGSDVRDWTRTGSSVYKEVYPLEVASNDLEVEDLDFVLLMPRELDLYRVEHSIRRTSGDDEDYIIREPSTPCFLCYRNVTGLGEDGGFNGIFNLIVTPDEGFFERWIIATHRTRNFYREVGSPGKEVRIELFQNVFSDPFVTLLDYPRERIKRL